MPTIIDSLIVQLGLDSQDVDSKAPGVRRKLADLETSATKTEKGFAGLTEAVSSFGAVLGGLVSAAVVTSFAKDIIATNTQLYYLGQNLGMSAQKLNAWGMMAKQLGGSSASIQGFFSQVRGMYGQLLTGQTPALMPFFARMGINYNQAPGAIMEQLAEKFKPFDQGPNRWKAASFLEASGISEPVANMILQGPEWVKSHEKELTALSPTDRQIQQSALMTQKIVSVEGAINKVGNNLLSSLMPVLNREASGISSILAWLLDHGRAMEIIAGSGAGLMGLSALAGVFKVLSPLVASFGTLLGAAVSPLGLLVAGIGALGVSLYELYKTSPWFKDKAQKAGSSISNAYQTGKTWTENELSKIEKYIGTREGFFAHGSKPTIPQRAHNPGDITYGDFAIKHGATGYITDRDGKKVAVFPDDATGKQAMDALLHTEGYKNLSSQDQIYYRWRTGRNPLIDGIGGATQVPSSISTGTSISHSHADNSKSVHIGTMNVNPGGTNGSPKHSVSDGMDWLFAPQFNGGLF